MNKFEELSSLRYERSLGLISSGYPLLLTHWWKEYTGMDGSQCKDRKCNHPGILSVKLHSSRKNCLTFHRVEETRSPSASGGFPSRLPSQVICCLCQQCLSLVFAQTYRYMHLISTVIYAKTTAQMKTRRLVWVFDGISLPAISSFSESDGVLPAFLAFWNRMKKSTINRPATTIVATWNAIPATMRLSPALSKEAELLSPALAATPPPIAWSTIEPKSHPMNIHG